MCYVAIQQSVTTRIRCITKFVADTLDFCVLNPLVLGGLDISLLLGGNPWRCDCKLAYIKHLQSGPMMVSIIDPA